MRLNLTPIYRPVPPFPFVLSLSKYERKGNVC